LHYAAGYGWQECIDLLIVHSADINANNMWKVTPITVAMLKNHTGIVKELLKHEVDVNGKDDKGFTLLHMACVDLTKPDVFDFV
jgi:ankyrin repeat protein